MAACSDQHWADYLVAYLAGSMVDSMVTKLAAHWVLPMAGLLVPRRVEQTVGLKAMHLAVTTVAEKAGLRADHSVETTAAKWVVCLELQMAALMVGWMVSRLDSEPVDHLEHQMVGPTVGQTVACLVER